MSDIPFNPTFWIDSKEEPNAPASGSGDEYPTNLADDDDYFINQSTSADQPTWEGDKWTFTQDQYYECDDETDNNLEKVEQITIAGVIKNNDESNSGNSYFYSLRDEPGDLSQIYLSFRDTDAIQLTVTDDDTNSNNINTQVDGLDNTVWNVFAATFDKNGELRVYQHDGSKLGMRATEYTQGDITDFDDEYIGRLVGSAGSSADAEFDLKTIMRFNSALSENQVKSQLIPYLKKQHGIGTTEDSKFPRVRLPSQLEHNPDILIDAKNEPDPPEVDSGDEFPTNLASYSDDYTFQDSVTQQPLWKGRDEGWELTDDGFKLSPNAWSPDDGGDFEWTMFWVYVRDNSLNGANFHYLFEERGNIGVGAIARSRIDTASNVMSNFARFDSGAGTGAASEAAPPGELGVIGMSLKLETSTSNQELTMRMWSSNGNTLNEDSTTETGSSMTLDRDSRLFQTTAEQGDFGGTFYEYQFIPKYIPDEDVKTLGQYLYNKWSI